MTTVYKYRIYCITQSKWEYIWGETAPTTCPVDTGHTVNSSSVSIVDTITESDVRVLEETTKTQGIFASKGWNTVITTGVDTVTTTDVTFKFPINALQISLLPDSTNIGDYIDVIVAPNTVIGTITSDVTAGNTIISVSTTVIQNIKLGYFVRLSDGTNTDELGEVIAIDTNNSTVTVDVAAVNNFAAVTPTYVDMSVHRIQSLYFGSSNNIVIGSSKIGGSYVPANTIVRLKYTNKGGLSKNFSYNVEYLF